MKEEDEKKRKIAEILQLSLIIAATIGIIFTVTLEIFYDPGKEYAIESPLGDFIFPYLMSVGLIAGSLFVGRLFNKILGFIFIMFFIFITMFFDVLAGAIVATLSLSLPILVFSGIRSFKKSPYIHIAPFISFIVGLIALGLILMSAFACRCIYYENGYHIINPFMVMLFSVFGGISVGNALLFKEKFVVALVFAFVIFVGWLFFMQATAEPGYWLISLLADGIVALAVFYPLKGKLRKFEEFITLARERQQLNSKISFAIQNIRSNISKIDKEIPDFILTHPTIENKNEILSMANEIENKLKDLNNLPFSEETLNKYKELEKECGLLEEKYKKFEEEIGNIGDIREMVKRYNEARKRIDEIKKRIEEIKENLFVSDLLTKVKKIENEIKEGQFQGKEKILQEIEQNLKEIEQEIGKRANQFNINILLQKKEVNKGIWNKNFLILENNGMTAIKNIKISFDGDVEVNGLEKINELKPKERKSIAFSIKSNEDGEIPVKIIAGFEAIGKEQKLAKNEWLSVKPAAYAAYGIIKPTEEEQKIRERVEKIYPKTEKEPPFRYGDFFSYKILNKIGSGGFCNVFLVKAKGKEYAMKIPKGLDISGGDTVYLDENDLKNYEREAKVWAMLTEKFPSDVIKLIDAGIQPFPWFVMELADTSLRQKMKSMKDKEKIDLIINLLDKLDRIHHYGVVHRDLKPENILFVNKKEKLTDFGLAKIVTKSSRSAISSGTPDYMAPEQVSSKRYGDVDWRTDIWQIGVVAYELLTNETPFKGDSYEEIGMAILFNDPLPLTEYGHDKEISNAIMNALQKNKEERYQSATEFKNELRKIWRGQNG